MKLYLLQKILPFYQRIMWSEWIPQRIKLWFYRNIFIRYYEYRTCDFILSTRYGFKLKCNFKKDGPIARSILEKGHWEPAVCYLIKKHLRKNDVFLDIGANIGYDTILASKIVGNGGKVYAVEPSESIRQALEENLRLNKIKNVTILPYGAWNADESKTLHFDLENRGATSLREYDDLDVHHHERTDETIVLRRIENEIPAADCARVTFVKMDIEGAELQAFQGIERILGNKGVHIAFEFAPFMLEEMGTKPNDLINYLEEHGFKIYLLPENKERYFNTNFPQFSQMPVIDGKELTQVDLFGTREF